MLPRIKYANQDDLEPEKKGWHVDPNVTMNVKFYQTNQNEYYDTACVRRDRTYHTLSFIYRVQNDNESLFFAYDEPYTYS